MTPYFETLFRKPLLLLLPAVLLAALVFGGTRALPHTYQVKASLWVEAAGGSSAASPLQTPSETEAQAFNERLSTLAFRKQVITDAGLADQVEAFTWPQAQPPASWLMQRGLTRPLGKALGGAVPTTSDQAWAAATRFLARNLTVSSQGSSLVVVSFTGPDPQVGLRLVQAATTAYLTEKSNAAQSKVDESQRLQDPVVNDLNDQVTAARSAFMDFGASLPVTPTAAQDRQLADLQLVYEQTLERLQAAQEHEADTALTALADPTTEGSFVSLVDAPQLPTSPTLGLRKSVLLTGFGAFLGLLLGALLVVCRTWLDRRLRSPQDVEEHLAAPVIGIVPLYDLTKRRTGTW